MRSRHQNLRRHARVNIWNGRWFSKAGNFWRRVSWNLVSLPCHPKLVTHFDALAWANLKFPLGRHHFSIGSRDFNTSIETSAIVSFNNISSIDIIVADSAIVWSLWSGVALFWPSVRMTVLVEHCPFLFHPEPGFFGLDFYGFTRGTLSDSVKMGKWNQCLLSLFYCKRICGLWQLDFFRNRELHKGRECVDRIGMDLGRFALVSNSNQNWSPEL